MNSAGTIAREWLATNKERFGSHDGLPAAFHRECLYLAIKVGSQVVIRTRHGNLLQGRAVMRGPAGWVLNMGGPYGTPGIACEENTVWVTGASRALGFGRQ